MIGLNKEAVEENKNGNIWFGEKELSKCSQEEWNRYRGKDIAMIFQDALVALNPTMKIGEQIIEGMQNHSGYSKSEQYDRAIEMLRLVSIPNPENCMKMYPHELSGGMRQRVMIASALVMKPQILIADEPTTALDVTIQAQIIELLKELQKKFHMSILLITHDLGLVADIADHIMVMYAGKIVEKGSCDDIFFHPKHPYTWGLLHAVPSLTLDKKIELATIEGSVPDMTNPPKGCAFCNRCKYAMRICRDVSIQSQIVNLLKKMKEDRNLTILFIAHDVSMVRYISDRIIVMYLGQIVEMAEAEELCSHPFHPYTQALLSAVPIPDPVISKEKQRIIMGGDVPSPIDPPQGCRFCIRCEYADEKCRTQKMQLVEVSDGHFVSCVKATM